MKTKIIIIISITLAIVIMFFSLIRKTVIQQQLIDKQEKLITALQDENELETRLNQLLEQYEKLYCGLVIH